MGGKAQMIFAAAALIWAAVVVPAGAQQANLFSSDAPLTINIEGPINAIARANARNEEARPAVLTLVTGESSRNFGITLAPRGLSRRREDVCRFPPLRVDFDDGVVRGTVFRGQNRLKLVTHCRAATRFEQYVILEYLAYRMYNVITPASFRVRPLDVGYLEANETAPDGRHFGFFIEDVDDVAKRNGRVELESATREIGVDQFDPAATTRYALFQYMIGNLDWDYRYGPVGEECCHNSKNIAREGQRTAVVPVPYDFDFAGFVNAPYAAPPEQINITSVRTRFYRGRCRHNDEVAGAAAHFREKRAEIMALIAEEPRLNGTTRERATEYMNEFWAILDDPARIADRLTGRCIQ